MDIKKIQRNVEASLAVEGAKVSKEAKEINKKFLKGEITSDKAIKSIIKKWCGGKNENT